MRIYIIGNDGITLCRETPATVNDGEVAVASKAELHAAPLSGKRLLALWNALPGVEKRSKVGDRGALIDRLWPAIEALPDPELEPDPKRPSKRDEVIAMLRRPEGVWVEAVEKRICRGQHETDQEKVEEIECKRKEAREENLPLVLSSAISAVREAPAWVPPVICARRARRYVRGRF